MNNREPETIESELFQHEVFIPEKQTESGYLITKVMATDSDRDEPHNRLSYTIDFDSTPVLMQYFEIDIASGQIKVNLQSGTQFDYDLGLQEFDIRVSIEDMYLSSGPKFQTTTNVVVKLVDVNDHAPEFPDITLSIPEHANEGDEIEQSICANDLDSGEYGRVSYEFVSIVAGML